MMRLLKALVIVAILSIASCTRGELSVQVRSDLSSKDVRTIGVLNYEWRGSLSTVEVEITDSEYYSKILKDAGTTYYFEFKCTSRKTPALKSALK